VFSISLREIADEFSLEELTDLGELEKIEVSTADTNRPGLQLAGFFEYFGEDRVQIFGKVEMTYLDRLTFEDRYACLDTFFSYNIPCVVVARGLTPPPEMIEIANESKVPIFRTDEVTSRFTSNLIYFLNVALAPRIGRHGVLVEVYGEGILILGESGVGKSETALELVKRGHRLVADDAVEIRKVSSKTLVGTAPDVIRHFIEIRGIGILDVKNLYGVGSVKMKEKIDLVINLELWDSNKQYDRVGLNDEYTEILGINIPSLTIPVRPGRNLAIIVEVAAKNNRQKEMGYNAAKVLNERFMGEIRKNTKDV